MNIEVETTVKIAAPVLYPPPRDAGELGCRRCGRFSWFLYRSGICGSCCNAEDRGD